MRKLAALALTAAAMFSAPAGAAEDCDTDIPPGFCVVVVAPDDEDADCPPGYIAIGRIDTPTGGSVLIVCALA